MNRKLKNICVYCGSAFGVRAEYREAAVAFGLLLAENNIRTIYGGGRVGLMGVLADAALGAGGEVVGVIPQALLDKEVGHGSVTQLHVVADMHERKMTMAQLADAFVALPGGWGTLEEWTETLTWRQLGIHSKPIGLLNVARCYDPLLRVAKMMIDEGFVRPEHSSLFEVDSDPVRLLQKLRNAPEAPQDTGALSASAGPPPAP